MLQSSADEIIEAMKLIDCLYEVYKENPDKTPPLTKQEILRKIPDLSDGVLDKVVTDECIIKKKKYSETYYVISEKGILLVENK